MMRKLMATTASSAMLLLGAVVGLEAVGLIFGGHPPQPRIASIQTGLDDPEALAAALLWQRQEEGQAEARRKAEEELRRFEAARQDAAGQAAEEVERLADALHWAERYRQRQVAVRVAQARVGTPDPPPAVAKPRDAAEQVQPQLPRQARDVKLVATAEPGTAPQTAPRPSTRRDPSQRKDAHRTGRSGCPFLRWLETVMAPPAFRRGTI